ncbi:MAG: AsmA-like C-terminal domain-containing protein [Deltaproteobacteria bacterium]|nr:AsmA-like C-terminal domain-containing protein [Deltaproteobacteria bacterium]
MGCSYLEAPLRTHGQKRITKWLSYATGVLLLLLVCIALLLPKFINTDRVKGALLGVLSQKISGTVAFQSVDISLFPVPRLSIDQARIAVPGKLDATVAILRIFPEILPLITGKVKLSKLQAQEPVIAFHLSDEEENRLPSAEQISAALNSLVSDTAGLSLSVENGSFSIIRKGYAPATLQQVDARIVANSKEESVTVTLDKLKIAAPRLMLSGVFSIRPSSPRLSLDIRGKGLSVGQTRNFVLSAAGETPSVGSIFDIVRDGTVPDITFHSQGDSFEDLGAAMNIEIKGELKQGSIHIPSPRLDFTAVKGAFIVSKGILRGTDITGVCGNSNLRQASFSLDTRRDDGPFHMESVVRADLQEVLVMLRLLVQDKAFLQELNLVRSLSGNVLGRLVLDGTIASVETRVTVSDMNLSARYQRLPFPVTVKGGSFTYDAKQISVKDLAGAVGQTTFSGIAARIDRGRTPQLVVRSGTMRIHAAETYGWLSSFERTRASLQDITSAGGSIAISSLAMNGPALSPEAWTVNAAGSSEGLTITSTLLPAALQLTCRNFSYDPKGISVEDLSATMGRSSAAGITGSLDSGNSPQLEIRSATANVDTAEIYPWLASRERMKASLREISAVSGTIALSTLTLKGPASVPKEWWFSATGAADNLVIRSPSLPDPLVLRQGRFTLSPGSIVLDAARTRILDTAATLSGTLMVSPEGLRGADVLIDAETGPKGMQLIKTVAVLPQIIKIQQRLSLARGHIITSDKGGLSFQGMITTQGGQILSLGFVREEKGLKISKLEIDDGASRASITLDLRERSWDMTFSGKLDSSTVAALIELEPMPAGHLAGDFTAHILRDRPSESLARGRLSGERILLPWKPGIPLQIDAMSLSADGSRIAVQSSRLCLADIAFSASGTLAFGKEGIEMEMEIGADRIEWKSLERIMGDEKTAAPAASGSASTGMPIRGTARVSAREFVYDKYTMSPLQADISFSPVRVTAHIRKAALCNITAQGRMELAGSDQNMEIALYAKDQNVGPAIACLSGRDTEMTGRFSLDGSFTMSLQTKPPLRGLEGTLSFRARDGKINKSIPLSGVFSLLSATEYFRGLPDLRKEGFTYSTVTIAGDIHQGTLSLKEAVIDGSTMLLLAEGTANLTDGKLDITVLAAPFKTLDSMFKILPERKGDSHASLVSIGVKVTGDIHNPDFSVQPISGISRGLSGVMERVLKAPVRIIESFRPSL